MLIASWIGIKLNVSPSSQKYQQNNILCSEGIDSASLVFILALLNTSSGPLEVNTNVGLTSCLLANNAMTENKIGYKCGTGYHTIRTFQQSSLVLQPHTNKGTQERHRMGAQPVYPDKLNQITQGEYGLINNHITH